MKLLLIQLSDMHFENTEQTHSIKVDKMISAIKANADAEECIIVISGDLAANSADAIIDAGANEVILFLHATCFDSGFNGVAFVFGDTKADGWIFMFVTHVESSCS